MNIHSVKCHIVITMSYCLSNVLSSRSVWLRFSWTCSRSWHRVLREIMGQSVTDSTLSSNLYKWSIVMALKANLSTSYISHSDGLLLECVRERRREVTQGCIQDFFQAGGTTDGSITYTRYCVRNVHKQHLVYVRKIIVEYFCNGPIFFCTWHVCNIISITILSYYHILNFDP